MLAELLSAQVVGQPSTGRFLAAFWMACRCALRSGAIINNLALIAHAYLDHLTPMLLLHAVLLPVNTYRLARLLFAR